MPPALRLAISLVIGLGLFLVPIRVDGKITVVVDVIIKEILSLAGPAVGIYCFLLITIAALCPWIPQASSLRTSRVLQALRVVGWVLSLLFVTGLAPEWLAQKKMGGLMWDILIASVGVIIPLGAVALSLLASYGALELVGTVMRPVMRPLFRLPGRAALDDLTSWLGSYSVGLYLTRKLVDDGYYNRREAFIIVTCFSTVSIGFVGVVCSTLDLLDRMPLVMGTYFVVVYALAAILSRTWPTTSIPEEFVGPAQPEPDMGSPWAAAMKRAEASPGLWKVSKTGFVDGLRLASSLLGTILAVGTGALLLAYYTPIFTWLGKPLIPLLGLLGLADPEILAPACVAGITEMYIPALLVQDAALPGKFFIAVLSISQLIFFSSVAPMMLDMFGDIPIRVQDLVALFLIRTAILIPVLAGLTHLYLALGLLS
jgi:nucleoside recognition membrane protein YjiH